MLPQLGIQDVAFSPDGSLLATASADGSIGLWLARSAHLVRVLRDGAQAVEDVAFNPDGTLLAAAGIDGATRVWTVATGDRLYLFTGHTNPVEAVAWSPDGRVLADASSDRSARLYAIEHLVGMGGVAGRPARKRWRHECARVRRHRSAYRDRG